MPIIMVWAMAEAASGANWEPAAPKLNAAAPPSRPERLAGRSQQVSFPIIPRFFRSPILRTGLEVPIKNYRWGGFRPGQLPPTGPTEVLRDAVYRLTKGYIREFNRPGCCESIISGLQNN